MEMMRGLFPSIAEQLPIYFETTTPEGVFKKQQFPVQDEQMNKEKDKGEVENAEKAKKDESCQEKAREQEAKMNEVKEGEIEQQMSGKEADGNDKDVEVCTVDFANSSSR